MSSDDILKTAALWMVLIAIVLLRNTFPFSFPTLYGEDGRWIGRLMTEGFWHTISVTRIDFAVAGLIMMEAISLYITRALFNSDLTPLPQVIAVVSAVYVSFVALLPYLCLRGHVRPVYCVLISASIVLLPVGLHGDEIFGRILNLGFYTTVIAQFALFTLLYMEPPRWGKMLIYAGVLILMWTFPPVIGQFMLFCAFYVLRNAHRGRALAGPLAAFLLLFALSLLGLSIDAFTSSKAIADPFDPSGVIEFVLARSTLYPLLAFAYTSLSNGIVVSVFAAFVVISTIYAAASRHVIRELTDFRIFLLLNFILVLAATLVLRRGFTGMYGEYVTSFPDRYFTGLNIMFLVSFMTIALTVPSTVLRRLAGAGVAAMIASWLVFLPIFERSTPSNGARSAGTLRDAFCDRARGQGVLLPPSKPGVQTLIAYPITDDHSWYLDVPQPIFDRTVSLQCPPRPNAP